MENEVYTELNQNDGGKVIFSNDVVATIAYLAANEVEGVASLISSGVSEWTKIAKKNNYTKGVKVDVREEGTTVDMTILVRYGYKIHEVCRQLQRGVKSAIETMTGLNVIAVNVSVQSIVFEKETASPAIEAAKESAVSEEEV